MGPVASAALGIGTSIAEGAGNAIFGQIAQNQQLRGQKIALRQQNEANYDYWLKTNYSAQKEQLAKAGLNPGLLYGMGGGAGGESGSASAMPQGQSVKGMDLAANMAQINLLKAQKENVEADTANKRRGAGLDDAGSKDVDKVVQDTATSKASEENLQAQKGLTDVNTRIQRLQEGILDETQYYEIGKALEEWQKLAAEKRSADAKAGIDVATTDQKIRQESIRTAGMLLEQEAVRKGMELTDAQIRNIEASITAVLRNSVTGMSNAMTNQKNASTAEMRELQNIADESGLSIEEVVDIMGKVAAGAAIGAGAVGGKKGAGKDRWKNSTNTRRDGTGYELK